MTSITESFRRRIADAERVLPLVGDTPPQVRIRLDFLKEMLDEIDAEHERRMAGGTRTARRVIVSDPATDCATGHCECGGCGGAVDPWDAWCRHCGARMEDA